MRRPAAFVVAAAAMLAGCSSEAAQPPPLPAVSPAVEVEASTFPSPEAVAVPSDAQESTPQGASAFARFFYAEVGRAYEVKDPEVVRRLSTSACQTCARFIESLTRFRDEEETASPVTFDIVFAETPGFRGTEAVVDVIYNSPATVRKDKSGKVILTEPAVTDVAEQVVLSWTPDGWLVKEVLAG